MAPRKRYRLLVLVPDHAQIACLFWVSLSRSLLLDIVGVLVLVHEHVAKVAGHRVRGTIITQQVVHEPL